MHHGSGPQNVQRQLQRSKSFTGSEAEEQQQQQQQQQQPAAGQQQAAPVNLPQSPAASFAPAASPSAPQSPNYQIIMSRSPVTGQNMNITLQNVGQMVTGNQQITLTPLPLQNPASPGFQHSAPQWRFEHGSSSSYIQVTSPLPQPMQPQSPTQHSPVPLQGVQRAGAPGAGLGVCGQSPTRFVDASMLVRQISLTNPTGSGHFVYQDGTGLAQLAPTTAGQVQLASPGTPGSVRERRLSQPHSQTGGTIHHLGPQSPVASGTTLPTLGSPGHITTSNLPPQISSIIQGQLARPMIFEKTTQGMVSGVGAATAASFGMPSAMPPSSPSRTNPPQGLPNPPLTPTGTAVGSVKKQQPKKLEEIAPSNPEVAQLRKQCLEHHNKKMESLKEVFKEYLIELFFLQHLQGNMMDYLAFKKKPCVPLFTYLRQNDLDLEEEEEEEQSEVINDEVKVVTGKDGQTGTPVAIATQLPPNVSAAFSAQQQQQFQAHQGTPSTNIANTVDIEAFKRQQALAQADQAKRPRIDVGRHGMIFQHPGVAPLGSPGVPLQQLMPTAQGGMPPTPQAVQIAGQKQSQQQYDPSKGPPVQNAASLHTPPPQLPGRLPPTALPITGLPLTLSQQQQLVETQAQPAAQLQAQVKVQAGGPILAPGNPHTQLQAQLQQQMQSGLHIQIQAQQLQQPQPALQPGQATVALVRPGTDSSQPCQRLMANSLPPSSMSPAPIATPTSHPSTHPVGPGRPATSNITPAAQSKMAGVNSNSLLKLSGLGQTASAQPAQESSQDKQAEQARLENQVHQRIAELRKEGQWTASRLPKLLEAPRPKSQWDYLLEEMQWMAADFAQERRWKMAAAKKLVRTCARYHNEQRQVEERAKKEEEVRLRHIASTIAREVEFFWSNIEQVVEIKLRLEIYEKRRKALGLQRTKNKGQSVKPAQGLGEKAEEDGRSEVTSARKRKASTSVTEEEVEDEESTIEEQEAMEATADHQAELAELTKEAEMPLDALVKQYAGAYAENFEWPQPSSQSEDEDRDEEMEESPLDSPHEAVLIDSLLNVEQHRGAEKVTSLGADGKPKRDIVEVATATELILPKGSARTTAAVRSPPPFLLHGSLREYQQIGVDWLASLHKKHLNGILADETGLGKTVQTVAFLAHLACQEGIWGPHLVVVRTCKMLSWEMEFKRWCPGLKILLYLGNKRERKIKRSWWSQPNSFHVCITSYKLLLKDQREFLKKRWKHLVLDEVQLIRNMTEKHWDTIFSIKSQQRLLLINTPLQNTLKELWTMIHFLLPGITRPYLDFPVKPGTDQNQDYCHKLVIRLHRMIQPFILRRTKRDVEKQLPKKYEHILKCRLSSRQKSLYEDVMTQPGAQEALKTGHFVSVLQVLMRLQRICNHPDLVQPRETQSTHVSRALQYNTASLVLGALQPNLWKTVDLSIFDLVSNENQLTRYETEDVVPKLRVSRQLIEEIYNAPDPPSRPKPCKIKPMRLFQPVQYGTKPEGRTVPVTSSVAQRTPTPTTASTTTATVSQPAQARGKSPVTTTATTQVAGMALQKAQTTSPSTTITSTSSSALAAVASTAPGQHAVGAAPAAAGQALGGPAGGGVPQLAPPTAVQVPRPAQASPQGPAHAIQQSLLPQRLVLTSQAQARLPSGDVVKITQLGQNRISQPETPVTLQFQGNKFTLSPSQLRQLTTGQPLQLQGTLGNILQIVSAPGQQILRPQGSMVMQPVPQSLPVPNTTATPGTLPAATSSAPQAPGVVAKATVTTAVSGDQGANAKSSPGAPTAPQESSEERNRLAKERLNRLFNANERRCARGVLYGADLLQACSVSEGDGPPPPPSSTQGPGRWRWVGRDSCQRAQHTCVSTVSHLRSALISTQEQQEAGEQLAKRFSCVVPAALAPPPQLYTANPPPRFTLEQKSFRRRLEEASAPHGTEIRRVASGHVLQFPDLQLLEMDSGKLEALAVLLHKLRSESRRVLIFTQMVKMLDILEMFLDRHRLTYVRVDENLPLEERQEQMKSFNRNRQVFCTILTNRCGSAVGHVFDADTIVFYDTDLNPSMDARTQEWCDKIGRSKDIHIYRLESGNSIEEKLLKNGTKDLIREVAAQGTDYTLAFLTQRTIQDLFEVESGSGEKVEEFVVLHQEPSPSETISPRVARPYIQALNSINHDSPEEEEGPEGEEEDLGEEMEAKGPEETSQLEELAAVMEQLTPIEKYALQYLEYLHISEDEEKTAMERVDSAKRSWEIQHLQKLKVEEEERMILEAEEDLFTYTREDAYNMEYVFDGEDGQTEIMPLWTPPTPPQDDNDIYIDSVICLMYDTVPMPESKLPPVYVRKEHKRLKMDPSAAGRKKKKGHGETVIPPRSLFDKASMLKVRREGKDQKKNFSLKQNAPFAKPLPSLVKPAMEAGQDNPEWLISEDWALLQAVKQLLELPLNLTIVSPAHTPNWDLVSDVVNSCSRIYRSPKQCRSRYENVIIPREEGKLVYEANPKKKTKSIYKSKNSRPLRTCQIYTQDDNATHIQLYNSRFELMKIIASKRSPPIKPLLGMNPFQKNPKHASVLAESGISYDKPLPPIQVASQRAERIAKEKKALAEQQRAQQLAQQTPGTPQAQPAAAQQQPQAPATGQAQAQGVSQAQAVAGSGAAAVSNTAVLAGAIKTAAAGTSIQTATVGGNVIVNTVAGVPPSPFQANKRLASPVIPGSLATGSATGAQVVHAQQRAVPAAAAPAEVVAIATGQSVRAVTPVTASAVVSTSLTPVQTQSRSLVTQVTPASGMQLPQGKQITPAHLQMFRQQQLQQQTASPQIKAVGKPQQQELLKLHKQQQKLHLTQVQAQAQQQQQQQQVAAAVAAAQQQSQQSQQGGQQQQQASQVQPAQAAQPNPQLTAVTAPRAGAVLAGAAVANLQVARLTRVPAQGQIQAQAAPTAQVTLTKPPVVSVPAVVSSSGVTTLPVTVAGISVAIGQAQKAGGQVVTHPFPQIQHVQQLLMKKQQQQAAAAVAAQQKAVQPQQGQATVQQKLATQQVTVQAPQPAQQQQKVTYATTTQLQPGIKTQFFTSIAPPQKPAGAQQIQIQAQPQTVSLSQTVPSTQQQVQVIPAGTATAQVVQQKLIQQQVVTAATSPQIQTPPPHSPAQQQTAAPASADSPAQQPKPQARAGGAMRVKTPAKPSGGGASS
ncbi:E1A-binding protein p400 isoform X2 [Megalops cyprinoides]|uniref:E1A-binding protein p400 isoform X2 n=1 Tax=Megalops cyprinoides TaxID=118141 RepID=UPI0018649763|nr:E1A-binding protein p400 isoform X2 [Megalops cyprinoides]